MRIDRSRDRNAVLKRGAALAILGALAAGCSTDVSRFSDTKLFTGATPNQRQIIEKAPANQPYPGDVSGPAATDDAYTGSINRRALEPVDLTRGNVRRSKLAPVMVDETRTRREATAVQKDRKSRSLLEPARSNRDVDLVETGTIANTYEPAAAVEDESREGGWTATGGTKVTLRSGETIYNLSRRFGVPVKAIKDVNGINDVTAIAAGSTVIIPTYVYSRSAPVSAPDNNPKVAKANSGRGASQPSKVPPKPSPAPNREAVIPIPASPRDRNTSQVADVSSSSNKVVANETTHKVVSGDSLYKIARKYGTTTDRLKRANGLSSGLIKVGQRLRIPAAGETIIAKVPDGVDPIITGTAGSKATKNSKNKNLAKYTPPKKAGDVIRAAKNTDTPDDTGIGKMRWPARGRVIAGYGSVEAGRRNDGIDIALPAGTPVKASENGVVIYAGDGLKEFGNTVLIRHENGLVTVYGHASKLSVSRGDNVKRGQEIARSGMTGTTKVPKLHFEVRDKSVPVNPMTYLQ